MDVSPRRFLKLSVCALGIAVAASGCESLSLQQLWKLNRQPNMDHGDAYFSIPSDRESPPREGDPVVTLEAPDP